MSVRGMSWQSATKQKSWSREHRESPSFTAGSSQCVAVVDAVRVIDPEKRLGDHVGYVSLADIQSIEKALIFVLDLS
jgi:mRNA-degrading endonuclease toxin of MazEF toxin-antitoxin module